MSVKLFGRHYSAVLIGLVVLVALTSGAHAVPTNTTVTFGISLTLNPPNPFYNPFNLPYQWQALYGYEMWVDWWNNLDASLRTITNSTTGEETTIDIQMHIVNDQAQFDAGLSPEVAAAYSAMAANASIDFLFAPIGKADSLPVARDAYENAGRAVMIGATDSSKGWYAIPGAYGSAPASVRYADSVLPYWRLNGVKTVSIMFATDVFQGEICEGFANEAVLNGIEVVGYHRLATTAFDPDFNSLKPNLTNTFFTVKDKNPDAILICDYNPGAEFLMSLFFDNKYSPKSLAIANVFAPPAIREHFEYVITFSTASVRSNYPPQQNFMDIKQFSALYRQRYEGATFAGTEPSTSTVQAVLSGMLYTNAIMRAQSIDQFDVAQALRVSPFDSFIGLSSFDINKRQLLDNLVLMQVNGEWRVVGPALATEFPFIFPFVPYESRTFNQKWGNYADITGLVLLSVGGLVALIWMIWTFVYLKARVIIIASRFFLFTMTFGALMANGGVVVYMPGLVSKTACILRVWLLPCGFMLMFSVLIGKLWTVLRIYYHRRNKHTAAFCGCPVGGSLVPERFSPQVAFFSALVFVPQLIFSTLLSSVTEMNSKLVLVDTYDQSDNYLVCVWEGKTDWIIFGINLAYGVAVAAWGIYLALKVRAIKTRHYDEGKGISFSFYNIVFFAIVVLAIRLAITGSNRGISFIIMAAATLLGTAVSLSSIFIGRIMVISKQGKDAALSPGVASSSILTSDRTLSSTTGISSTTSTSSSSRDINALKSVYQANRTRIAELEQELSLLRGNMPQDSSGSDEEN